MHTFPSESSLVQPFNYVLMTQTEIINSKYLLEATGQKRKLERVPAVVLYVK